MMAEGTVGALLVVSCFTFFQFILKIGKKPRAVCMLFVGHS
jgi:hypothetical protein